MSTNCPPLTAYLFLLCYETDYMASLSDDIHSTFKYTVQSNKTNASDFDFEIAIFFDGDVPHSTSYGAQISQFIRCARVSFHVTDFNDRKI